MSKQGPYEAYLKLETGAHTARVRQLLVTPDQKTLITSGEDKSIRLWDIESKKQVGMLLGQIGVTNEAGKIQTIALSRDGKYLVALIWLNPIGTYEAHERESDVRVYELVTGNLQARFRYPGTLQDLDFSAEGKYLALVGNPKIPDGVAYSRVAHPERSGRCGHVYVYESKKLLKGFGPLPFPLKEFMNVVYDNDTLIPSHVRFVPDQKGKTSDYRIVVATWNHNKWSNPEYTGRLLWYSFSSKGMRKVQECNTEEEVAPEGLAVSRELVVITGDVRKFFCYDHSGSTLSIIPWETKPAQPVFSSDGKLLILGQKDDSDLVQVKVYNTPIGRVHLKSTYYGHDAEALAVGLLQDGTAVSAGGDQYAIRFWDPVHTEGEQTGEIRGVGRVVRGVGVNQDEQIGIGHHGDLRAEDGNTILQRVFDLRTMTLRSLSLTESASFQRMKTTFENQTLEKPDADLYLEPVHEQVRRGDWYDAITFGFTQNGAIVAGAHDGKIHVIPRSADRSYPYYERLLFGHTARLLDHAVSNKWLVTAGKDQVIRLWYVEDVEKDVTTSLEPALNLFVGMDDEWVIWSKSGYYNASQRGDRRFGYHINRGTDKESLFFSSDRLIKTYFRPDIIQAIIEEGSEEQAFAKLKKRGATIPKIVVTEILPPIVELEENGILVTKKDVKFKFTVDSLGKPVTRVWIIQNDQFVWKSEEQRSSYTVKLMLKPGRNRFKILAENENAKSPPIIQVIMAPEPSKGKSSKDGSPLDFEGTTSRGAVNAARSQMNIILSNKGNGIPENGVLYLLAVGVSKLEKTLFDGKPFIKPLQFAHLDAISFYNAFARSSPTGPLKKNGSLNNKAFKAVEATILQDEEAKKEAILGAIDSICKKILESQKSNPAQRDVFMIFLSGHGIPAESLGGRELYFWNYDFDPDKVADTGLSFIELGQRITSLPAEIVFATDACHSGMAGSDMVRGVDPNELAKRIYAINERGIYILNASRSEEVARESSRADIQHGIFTKSILEALDNLKGDINMLNMIAYVQERVTFYTSGTQTPVCRMYGDLLPLIVYRK